MSGAPKQKMPELQIANCKLKNANCICRCSARQRSATSPEAFVLTILFALSLSITATAQTRRVVAIKVDGLPYELVERFAHERDPHHQLLCPRHESLRAVLVPHRHGTASANQRQR